MRKDFLPFHLPSIGPEETQSVLETLESGWLTTGPRVREFEKQFSHYVGCRESVAVNSGTAALHLALDAVGVREGDEVLVPTMTFAATAEVVTYFKAKPALVDCEPDTMNLDPKDAEAKITSKTKAIIPVHFGGHPCDMAAILDLAKQRGLKVVEDAAHALPAAYEGKKIGTMGDVTCFSFYATKTITTGEGGMLTTENEEYADKARIMSLHGISKDAWKRYSAEGTWRYDILYPGYKYNLTDIAAAIGIGQLKKCDLFAEQRGRLAAFYRESLSDLPEITLPTARDGIKHAWHLYVIRLHPERLRIDRDRFIDLLKGENIGTSVHFIPLHLHPYYRKTFGHAPTDFPHAQKAFDAIVSLPIYPKMSPADATDVVEAVRKIVTQNRR